MDTSPRLHPALLTSSSLRNFADLFGEVGAISGVSWFDLLILRDIDLDRMNLPDASQKGRMAEIVADHYDAIKDWILAETESRNITVSAFATYFPEITSVVASRREKAIQAVANTISIAIELQRERPDQMPQAIVEIVCGTILDQKEEPNIEVYGRERKLDLLCESLLKVVERVTEKFREADPRFAIALEMEPGETYVLNSVEKMKGLAARFDGKHKTAATKFGALRNYVGFNLDIAHLRIAGIQAADLDDTLLPKIVHAHIADHPFRASGEGQETEILGMHTHDQFVGSWTNVLQRKGGYQPYLLRLVKRAAIDSEVLFSKAIAVELEGCNRVFSVHDSLSRLKHLLERVQPSTG
jgi:sugar phosphate isomerase/epimerase